MSNERGFAKSESQRGKTTRRAFGAQSNGKRQGFCGRATEPRGGVLVATDTAEVARDVVELLRGGAARPSPDHLSSAAVALRFARPSRKMRLRRSSPYSSPVAAAATAGAGVVAASEEKAPRPARAERRGGPEPPDRARAAWAATRGSTDAIYLVVRSAA
jgi:hypothetical protein